MNSRELKILKCLQRQRRLMSCGRIAEKVKESYDRTLSDLKSLESQGLVRKWRYGRRQWRWEFVRFFVAS